MASIRKEIVIESSAEDVWEVIGDFAAGPSRMAPGFVLDTRVEADCRIVTFADGTVVRERRVSVDHDTRRIVYAVVDGTVQPEHDNASMQVLADGERRCRLVWIRDVLPDELGAPMAEAMSHGLEVVKRTLDDTHDPQHGSRV
jgi:polyketide cyclase/dehydrase/lipid transport protein